ncbi:MAG TPA: signal recognition particle subunit SRP19/SEC65 family protein [Nitrososphaeraceae archaeon]|nr:signal recognition particle subunit SRP19/SEC65 family protein [Nitrososphaeraceae archaeon]
MKDYEHVIIWLDYLNKNLSRRKGRRIKRDQAVFDPTFSELFDAAIDCGLNATAENSSDHARYPRRSFVRSGYIMIPKIENKKKFELISTIASKISARRTRNKRT